MSKKDLTKNIIAKARELVELADKNTLKTLVPFIAENIDCKKLFDQLQAKAVKMAKQTLSSKEIENKIEGYIQKHTDKIITQSISRYIKSFFDSNNSKEKVYKKFEDYIEKNNLIDKNIANNGKNIDRYMGNWIEDMLDYIGDDEEIAHEINKMIGEKMLKEAERLLK